MGTTTRKKTKRARTQRKSISLKLELAKKTILIASLSVTKNPKRNRKKSKQHRVQKQSSRAAKNKRNRRAAPQKSQTPRHQGQEHSQTQSHVIQVTETRTLRHPSQRRSPNQNPFLKRDQEVGENQVQKQSKGNRLQIGRNHLPKHPTKKTQTPKRTVKK